MDKGAPSAGEHEWREIKVLIQPTTSGGATAVFIRRHRGGALVWDRRLGVFGLPAGAAAATETAAGVLRAAAAALEAAADRMDRL